MNFLEVIGVLTCVAAAFAVAGGVLWLICDYDDMRHRVRQLEERIKRTGG